MIELIVKSSNKKQVIDITDDISTQLSEMGAKDGLCHLIALHTTVALSTADLDPGGTDQDYLDALDQIIPKLDFKHPHDPAHMPDHILSSLIGTSLTIPVKNSQLVLGTWQRVALFEFNGPQERKIVINFQSL